jgi:hypothetical protein
MFENILSKVRRHGNSGNKKATMQMTEKTTIYNT